MIDMIDRLVALYRKTSTETRRLIVFFVAAALVVTTMSFMTFPAAAMTRKNGEEQPDFVSETESEATETETEETEAEEEIYETAEETVSVEEEAPQNEEMPETFEPENTEEEAIVVPEETTEPAETDGSEPEYTEPEDPAAAEEITEPEAEPAETEEVEEFKEEEELEQTEAESESEETEEEEKPEVLTFTGTANRINVTVEYEEDAFPEGTTMEVKTVGDPSVINAINDTVTEENKEVVRVQAVDIIFRDSDGNEIEPSKPIKVTMKSMSAPQTAAEKPVVVHVDDQEGPTVIETSTPEDEPEDTKEAVTFEAGSFSVYAIVYTIETYYTSYDGETYKITVGYNTEAEIPEGAGLDVREIMPGTDEYSWYLSQSAATLGLSAETEAFGRFFDISIVKDGIKIEPAATVSVSIELDEMPADDQTVSVVHFKEYSIETIERVTADAASLQFETDSFSVYGIVSSGATSNLNGRTFAIVNTYTNNAVQAKMIDNNKKLAAESVEIRNQYLTANDDISMWTFRSVRNNRYYIQSADADGRYINISNDAVRLSDRAQELNVAAGTGDRDGKIRISDTSREPKAINNYSGSTASGFGPYSDNGNNEWFTLYELESIVLNPAYAAEKISVQDMQDAQRVVIYKSVYNESTAQYEEYVIDGNGNLVKAFDKGDQVVGRSAVSTQWVVTIHRDEATGQPNGYYDFYNEETKLYLSPSSAGIVSTERPGIMLEGRSDGEYNSSIETWDAAAMAYYGYRITTDEGGNFILASGTGADSKEFSFAAYISETTPQLHPVATVDSQSAGITIRMFNYPDRATIANVTGSDGYTVRVLPPAHASYRLNAEGYPTFKNGSSNGKTLFIPEGEYYKGTANHLFLESVYDSTGYYEYNAFNNFAHYNQGAGTFTVYQEMGTPSNDNQFFYKRGNFFPYNDLDVTRKATNRNLYDGSGEALDPVDPTNGGELYLINNSDCYFGMTMEATFMQAKDGMDKNGPVIYDFNGDDDLWIYIDGVLILDIGGVHDAWPGSINFATGEIIGANGGAGGARTIKDAFRNAGVFPDGTPWNESRADEYFKGNTFADYGSHSFKMFYMEHGASASNLEMRFNLPVIEKGKFTVEKVLAGTDQQKYSNVYFAYQAFRKENGNDVPLTNAVYEGTTTPVTFYPSVSINGKTYTNVFYLKPGEAATFAEMPEYVEYYVQELGVGSDYYDKIEVNDVKIDGEDVTPVDGVYPTTVATVANRARVTYSNHCSEKNLNELRITKRIAEGSVDDGTEFEFRVLLENADGQLVPYSRGNYYIQNDEGVYFYYVNGKLTSNGMTPIVASTSGQNGTISRIPADYTVVIDNLLAGTDFFVEEIRLKDGWQLESKNVLTDTCDPSDKSGTDYAGQTITADGQIKLDTAAKEVFTNKGSQRILVNKVWNSGNFVTSHGDIHVALFTVSEGGALTLVKGSVRTITSPAASLEYQVNNINSYVVREVVVDGTAVTPVSENGAIEVRGETTAVGNNSTDVYIVTYEQGEVRSTDENGAAIIPVRTDTITNRMPVLTVNKTDPDNRPLKGAEFTLLKEDKTTPVTGYASIISTDAEAGNLLHEVRLPEGIYYLKEVKAPDGYNALKNVLKITVEKNGTIQFVDTGKDQVNYSDYTDQDTYTFTYRVVNNPGVELPKTGGPGTRLFAILGSILILGAGLLLQRR